MRACAAAKRLLPTLVLVVAKGGVNVCQPAEALHTMMCTGKGHLSQQVQWCNGAVLGALWVAGRWEGKIRWATTLRGPMHGHDTALHAPIQRCVMARHKHMQAAGRCQTATAACPLSQPVLVPRRRQQYRQSVPARHVLHTALYGLAHCTHVYTVCSM